MPLSFLQTMNLFLHDLFPVVNYANFACYADCNSIFDFVENIDNTSASMSLQSWHYKYGQKEYFSGFWIVK